MKDFIAHYFSNKYAIAKSCNISALSRIDAINRFEELYPNEMLVALKQV